MKVRIEIKTVDEETGVSKSTSNIVEGTLKDVLKKLCEDAGYAIYALNPDQNRGALALPTLYLHKVEYDEKHHIDYKEQ
jgi:hypothetical protein